MKNKKNKKIFIKVICGSSILSTAIFIAILVCILMILDFFGTKLSKEKIQNNSSYANAYTTVVNKYISSGYVPLQRVLYFYLEDDSLTIDTIYNMNLNYNTKSAKEIDVVCDDVRVKNHGACTESNIKENEEYLLVPTPRFNFPLDNKFTVTSFYNEQRVIFGESNAHSGWDFATEAETPVYSVCSGTVENVNFTQKENIPYDQSKNEVGNTITIKCNDDFSDAYYVVFRHLYPNSAKVNVGDKVDHWTEIASVGTTGHSTGNHLHYEVRNSKNELLDGMQLVDLTLSNPNNHDDYFEDKYNKQDNYKEEFEAPF